MGHTLSDLSRAIIASTQAHDGQFDKSGVPYILHPLRVMLAVPAHLRIPAVLHDVVEDTRLTVDDLNKDFGPDVATVVDALSRRPTETYAEFIIRCANHSPGARIIKRADIQDNLNRITPDLAGIEKRYQRALIMLED